jgi:selenocysteine lyase/cysteine desulfurase
MNLEEYFSHYRQNTIGYGQKFVSPYGEKEIVYADWTASGRLYRPIEEVLAGSIGPFVGNTHTETTVTGSTMTLAYHKARKLIKNHVGAVESDVVICSEAGMTGVINKFQRILGIKLHERFKPLVELPEDEIPVIFVTSMEHHSNQTSWVETIADVEVVGMDADGLFDFGHFGMLLDKYANRKLKIAAITSCSNVTGIMTPYHQIAEMIHSRGGLCFVDFACSAPYIDINMHPANEAERLDAIFFSPHKFLGGPGSTGVLVFDSALYHNRVPDNPGGGTVDWTNPWGEHKFVDSIEAREDGGTPPFLQTIKVALAIKLKEEMGVGNMMAREKELLAILWDKLCKIDNLHILAGNIKERLAIISFYIDGLHYNLAVRLLNDKFGIQVRGGCSCAGTYGHYLLNVTPDFSRKITEKISHGDLSDKPGWVRLSVHPIMADEEARFLASAIEELAANFEEWSKDYVYEPDTNEFHHKGKDSSVNKIVDEWL